MNYETWYRQMLDISYNAVNTLASIRLPSDAVVVFDIDDTLIHSNGGCIIPMINVFNHVKDVGLTPIIITNRSGDTDTIDKTQKQLNECGIFGYKSLYFRKPTISDNPYKYKESARRSIHERGMTVVMSIGDQVWDIGRYAGIGMLVPSLYM